MDRRETVVGRTGNPPITAICKCWTSYRSLPQVFRSLTYSVDEDLCTAFERLPPELSSFEVNTHLSNTPGVLTTAAVVRVLDEAACRTRAKTPGRTRTALDIRLGATLTGTPPITADTATGTAVYDPFPANISGYGAYNPVILAPPAIPVPPIPTQFTVAPPAPAQDATIFGLSIQLPAGFVGFSIEMSVINQVPFLNLMALLQKREGTIRIRVGGNTQDYATEIASLPNYKIVEKLGEVISDPTETPALVWTPDMIYLLGNVSALVDVNWWLGIPFNDTSNLRLQIAELGEGILGDRVLGFQVGNEPDLYANHGHRPVGYTPQDYSNEFGVMVNAVAADANIPVHNNLLGPGVSGTWTPEDVWSTGFITTYASSLGALVVERYPNNNCAARYPNQGFGNPIDPQAVFPDYLTHASGQNIVGAYISSTQLAQAAGKPFIMFETNTASCGGFPGLSDSFGSALWAADYTLQMGFTNFSGANFHVGGVDDTYNPFLPPPTNMSTYEKWTIFPIFYGLIATAEAIGSTGTAQVLDMSANAANPYTPGYAIYEQGTIARIALFNYITDPSGASNYVATIALGGATPAQVSVKYLLAESVSVKENITWAGQTFGTRFTNDGTLSGTEQITTVACDQTAQTCQVSVPAPGLALVFLSSGAMDSAGTATQTFPTTTATNAAASATVNASALATSNGESGADRGALSSTSKGSASGARRAGGAVPGAVLLVALLAGAGVVRRAVRLG
ncbi:glycoside hydrolase family 79 protein [Amylocystis lapponica]|nr:glycoside hydrolase family 79 protein [Amylocystis lapponica]